MAAPHTRTVVWQWASGTTATPDPFGDVIKILRSRHDMTHRFPNRRYMYEYLTGKAKVEPATLGQTDPHDGSTLIDRLWKSYRAHEQQATAHTSDISPEQLAAALTKRAAS
jgi:hypothetical protein